MKLIEYAVGAALCCGAWQPLAAQNVYKCVNGNSVTYSQQACGGRVIDTREAKAPARPNAKELNLRHLEQKRILAQTLRRRPGETIAQFDTRRRRAGAPPEAIMQP